MKDTLLQNTGMAGVHVIRIIDADYQRSRMLYLEHEHDGRDLQTEYRQHTMKYLYHLWGRKVVLATRMQEQPISFAYGEDGVEAWDKAYKSGQLA